MPLMRLFRLGIGKKLLPLLLLAGLTGTCNLLLIKTISELLTGGIDGTHGLVVYHLLLVSFFLVSRAFGLMLLRTGVAMTAQIRTTLVRAIARARYTDFLATGQARGLACLTNDTRVLAEAPDTLIMVATSSATLIACLGYLAWLSLPTFGLLFLFIIIGVSLFEWQVRGARDQLVAARHALDRFLLGVEDLFGGFKELAVHSQKRHDLVEGEIVVAVEVHRQHELAGGRHFVTANVVSNGFIFLVMGLFVGGMHLFFAPQQEMLVTFVFVMLYLIGPIRMVQSGIQGLIHYNVAAGRIAQLFDDLGLHMGQELQPETPNPPAQGFASIALRDVCFTYPGDEGFAVGPINLSLHKGEIVFLRGGNGSGKTTLLRLLLGLYQPSSGQLLWDAQPVDPSHFGTWQRLFASVFSDFHLFQKLYGLEKVDPTQVDKLLQTLVLADKVRLVDDAWHTRDLSQGQRRRLGLLGAWLEESPILIFDELAADQDPSFRAHFYQNILPTLKQAGKTVLAITHDEAWFHCCDRLFVMEGGQLYQQTAAPMEGG